MRFDLNLTREEFLEERFENVHFRSQVLQRRRHETFKNEMVGAAFVGWQMGAGDDRRGKRKPFSSYLKALGLSEDKAGITKEERKEIAEKAYKTGAKVMNLFKGKIKR